MKQIAPDDVWFKDSITGTWSQVEGPDSIRRRLNFTLDKTKSYVKVIVANNVKKVFPPETGLSNLQPNYAKEVGTNGYPGFFVYEQ